MTRWYFDPILDSFWAVVGLAVFLVLLLRVTPKFRRVHPRQLITLLVLRTLIIVGLLLAMLRPTVVSTRNVPQTASLIFLCDQSRSLQVTDSSDGMSRWQALLGTLRTAAPALAELSDLFDVKAYSFDEKTQSRDIDQGLIQLPEQPAGDQTDIAFALDDVLRRELGKRVAGLILLSDGAQRAHRPTVDLQQTARDMARLGYPLYTIAFGRPRDQSQARDIAVQNIQDQYTVFVKNELVVRGTVRVQGYVHQPIKVRMHVHDPTGKEQVVAATDVTASEDGQQVRFEFQYTPEQSGQHTLEIKADEQPGELVVDNNRLSAFLQVLEGGMRVLMLHGNVLGAEQQILRQSIGSSPDIQLDEKWVDVRTREAWPVDLSEALSANYDVFLIADVDAGAIGDENAGRLAELVDQGKGLMMTGGIHAFGPGHYAKSPLADVLPIVMDRFEGQELDHHAEIRADRHIPGPLRMLPARPHFITRLAADSDNEQAWKRLQPLDGANKFSGIRAGSLVLARAESGSDLLVSRQYGDGRVLAFAGDSTHRWWRHGHQAEHKRFWRQAMLWLAKKDETQNQDVWIAFERRRFRPGDGVRFTVGARDVDGEPIHDAELRAELVYPNGHRQPISLSPDETNWAGYWDEILAAGQYAIEVSAARDGRSIGTTSGQFVVIQEDLELTDPAANIDQMEALAGITSSAGGRAVAPELLAELLESIRRSPPDMNVQVESRWQLGDTNLDAGIFFVFLVGLMSAEWYLRKKWGFV